MKIESIAISRLHLDPSNARKHSEKNLSAIKGSLVKFGQQKPIVVDENYVVVAGNGTLEAAKALGWDKIDVVQTDLTGIDKTAFALADNKTTDLSEWDDDVLDQTLKQLAALDFDIEAIGFDVGSLIGDNELDDNEKTEEEKILKIEVIFDDNNEMSLLYEELISRGYLAKLL